MSSFSRLPYPTGTFWLTCARGSLLPLRPNSELGSRKCVHEPTHIAPGTCFARPPGGWHIVSSSPLPLRPAGLHPDLTLLVIRGMPRPSCGRRNVLPATRPERHSAAVPPAHANPDVVSPALPVVLAIFAHLCFTPVRHHGIVPSRDMHRRCHRDLAVVGAILNKLTPLRVLAMRCIIGVRLTNHAKIGRYPGR